MNELDLILSIIIFGFSGVFTILWYMVKTFIRYKEKSDLWKLQHDVRLAEITQQLKDENKTHNSKM